MHEHYLKDSVFCGSCGSRLCMTFTQNRYGTRYTYWFCLGRNQRRTSCLQPAMDIDAVEAKVTDHWLTVQLTATERDVVRAEVRAVLSEQTAIWKRDADQLQRQRQHLTEQRRKLLEAHLAGAMPVDLMREEMERITRSLEEAYRHLATGNVSVEQLERRLDTALHLLTNCYALYVKAPPPPPSPAQPGAVREAPGRY